MNDFFDLLKGSGVSCVYEVWEWRSEIVDISGKIILKFIRKVRNIAARVPRGRPTSLQGCPWGGQNRSQGCPAELPKNRSRRGRPGPRKWIANGCKTEPQIARLLVFFCDIFNIVPHNFWDDFFMGFSMVWERFFIIFMIYLCVFGYLFETSCFG